MKINHKILSIPPYISTSWKNIASLHVEYDQKRPFLIVTLHSGQRIEIPGLETQVIEAIFHTHTKFMEQEQKLVGPQLEQISFALPMKGVPEMGTFLQHNQEQANSPPLPADVLQKIAHIAESMGIQDSSLIDAEPHCNCPYCQIVRAIHQVEEQEQAEEEVTDEDLRFQDWKIESITDKLFIVTDPINKKEKYQVFLGEPVGCTCGKNSCEHILAALRS